MSVARNKPGTEDKHITSMSRLHLLDMAEDVLIKILSDIDVNKLIKIKLVCRKFADLVSKTIQKKKIIDRLMYEEWPPSKRLDLIKNFGPKLLKLDLRSLTMMIKFKDCERQKIMSELATKFPELEDFGFVSHEQLDDVIYYASHFRKSECKLRSITFSYTLTDSDMGHNALLNDLSSYDIGSIFVITEKKFKHILELCLMMSEFRFALDSWFLRPLQGTTIHQKTLRNMAKFVAVVGKMVSKLTLFDEAVRLASAVNVGSISDLEELVLTATEDVRGCFEYAINDTAQGLLELAPNITSFTGVIMYTGWQLLAQFSNLEKVKISFTDNVYDSGKINLCQAFFKLRGHQLIEVDLEVWTTQAATKLDAAISRYCVRLEKLTIKHRSRLDLKKFAKLRTLSRLGLDADWLVDGDLKLLLEKLVKLDKFVIFYASNGQRDQLYHEFKKVRQSLLDEMKVGKRKDPRLTLRHSPFYPTID